MSVMGSPTLRMRCWLDDEQTERQLMAGRLDMLYRDRSAYSYTTLLMEREAKMYREAWGRSMDASDLARLEIMSLRTTVLGQHAVITELHAADRRRQEAITELLAMIAFQRQQGPAKGLTQPDAPGEAENGTKRAIRSNTALETTTTTTVTNAQLQEMIDQGVIAALAARDANRSTNGDDSHVSGTSVRRTKRVARECSNMKIIDKYCPRDEIKKLEAELWNLKVKESDKIERYVGGLPYMIHRSVVASRPKTMQEAIEIATELMDKKICTFAECQTENKRK
ncbi:hypothetical protein Tco_1397452 [Tanacetum coccineum]